MNANYFRITLVFWLVAASSMAQSTTDERFVFPPRTDSWWVSQGDLHNQQTLHIKRFKSYQSVQSVLEFYKVIWGSDSDIPGYMESNANGWQMISQIDDKYQQVVQVRESSRNSGSEGMISLMPLFQSSKGADPTDTSFTPTMQDAELLSTNYSYSPTPARTQTQVFSGLPITVARRFKVYVKKHDWILQDEYRHKNTVIQRFENSQRQLDVAFVGISGSKTLVFVSEMSHVSK